MHNCELFSVLTLLSLAGVTGPMMGGGDQIMTLKFQVNSTVIPLYKNREKRIFEFGDRVIGSKIKVVESGRYDLSKHVREGH